jgi:predicted RNA-binding Zn-ribbon protein involved in translation (DUF1610 family)
MAHMIYLTAQCPKCREWFHPTEAEKHEGACKRRPWARRGNPRNCSAPILLVPHLDPTSSHVSTIGNYVYVASPIDGVSARRWAKTAEAAIQHGYEPSVIITNMQTATGWELMHKEFPIELIPCPHCGEDVIEAGLLAHTTKSVRCHWLRADAEVTKLRAAGYQDPYAMRPTVPLTWTALRSGPWRNTTTSVTYPRAIQAVLLRAQ